MHTRRGSFLLACISMMALMAIVGFALLRNIQLQSDTSTLNQRVLLSQSAAQAGVVHATEQILKDYASDTIAVGSDTSGLPNGQVNLPARQFLQGPYRAPFTAIDAPDRPDFDLNAADADKDVRTEHHLLRPWLNAWCNWDYYWSWSGITHLVGRARYYEPNYYNTTRQPRQPVDTTSFVDLSATLPERSEGMFYDDRFRRIDKDPATARADARYRLRYAVAVEDLNGHLLVNPQAAMKLPDDYRNPPNWVARAGDALASMMVTQDGATYTNTPNVCAHFEHVLLGRGWSGNVDQDAKGFPVTFPLMYRYSDPNDTYGWWHVFQRSWPNGPVANQLFRSKYVLGKKAGGESCYTDDDGHPISHALVGPQMSWWNLHNSIYEGNQDWSSWYNSYSTLFALTPFGRSLVQPKNYPAAYAPARRKWYEGRVNTPFYVNVMTAPPWVIDAMLVAYLPPKYKIYKYTWIQFVMFVGYNQDGGEIWDWNQPNSGMTIDGNRPENNSGAYGRDLLVDTTTRAFAEFGAPQRDATSSPPSAVTGEVIKPDYYIDDPRFGRTVTTGGHTSTVTAYDQIYPGIAWNGDPDKKGEGSDDAGAHIDTDTIGYGYDVHTWQPFVHLDPGGPWGESDWYPNRGTMTSDDWKASDVTTDPPAWFKDPNATRHRFYKYPDPHRLKYQDSYWWDLFCAMSMSISVMRAQWMQYDNGYFGVDNLFPPGQRDPSRYQSIRDLDRQFLAELGESLEQPGTADPATLTSNGTIRAYRHNWRNQWPWGMDTPNFTPWTASNNIKSAKDQSLLHSGDQSKGTGLSDQDRAAVMERVLNDWRMSFFGSSPEYSDGIDPTTHVPNPALEFRPLDFDGDGIVHCSCYQSLTGAPVANPSAVAEAGGRGPKPDPRMYYAPTGCFFTGKSHYFRVISRGEVWDNRLNTILNESTLESVLAVDPEGTNVKDTQSLYQRWHFDTYQGMLPHIRN
jgi:hypothetical protein